MAHKIVSAPTRCFSAVLNLRALSLLSILLLAGPVIVSQATSTAFYRQATDASGVRQRPRDVQQLEPGRPIERELASGW